MEDGRVKTVSLCSWEIKQDFRVLSRECPCHHLVLMQDSGIVKKREVAHGHWPGETTIALC